MAQALSVPFCLGDVRGDRVHERRRKAVVRREAQLLEAVADLGHLFGLRRARLDDGRHERRELGLRPALVLRQLHVHEVEAEERMVRVLDAAVHVHAAAAARMALDGGAGVDDLAASARSR